jgi:hypothetical protein
LDHSHPATGPRKAGEEAGVATRQWITGVWASIGRGWSAFTGGFLSAYRPTLEAWRTFSTNLGLVWDDIRAKFTSLKKWLTDWIGGIGKLLPKLPQFPALPKWMPPATPPPGLHGAPKMVPMTGADYARAAGQMFGKGLNFFDAKSLAGVAALLGSAHTAMAHQQAQATTLAKAHGQLATSEDRLAKAVDGLSGRIGGIDSAVRPNGPAPVVHLHVHGVSDPHKIAKAVTKIITGGGRLPQQGMSNHDPSASMPHVGTRDAS